jgi:TolB-like protein
MPNQARAIRSESIQLSDATMIGSPQRTAICEDESDEEAPSFGYSFGGTKTGRDEANAVVIFPVGGRKERRIHPDAEDIAPAQMEEELLRVLRSRIFARSPRMRRLLEFIVRRSARGDASSLKEYTLGLEVFDRDSSFDPGSDPIVRVEALRLRNRLTTYYATEGIANEMRIELPKGRYVPVIHISDGRFTASASVPEINQTAILVLPFVHHLENAQNRIAAVEMVDNLIHLLTQSSEVRVVSRISSTRPGNVMDACELGAHYRARLIVEGKILTDGDFREVIIYLVDAEDGYNLWSARYDSTILGMSALCERIASDLLFKIESLRQAKIRRVG